MAWFSAAITFALVVTLAEPVGAEPHAPHANRVRSSNARIVALIQQAQTGSATFSRIVETIDNSDGLVYVEEGRCGHGVRACLVLKVVVGGPHRFLRIHVDMRRGDSDLMESIGHELRHAIEVLSDPTNTSDAAVFFFYHRAAIREKGVFETDAAVAAGAAVRREISRSSGLVHSVRAATTP